MAYAFMMKAVGVQLSTTAVFTSQGGVVVSPTPVLQEG
jgi:hypothetical protein